MTLSRLLVFPTNHFTITYFYTIFTSAFRLRALSDGNSVTSPPPSPGFPKYKLADYRYGREEMLALYNPGKSFPEDLKSFPAVLSEKPLEPLAYIPLSEEEQVRASLRNPLVLTVAKTSLTMLMKLCRQKPSYKNTCLLKRSNKVIHWDFNKFIHTQYRFKEKMNNNDNENSNDSDNKHDDDDNKNKNNSNDNNNDDDNKSKIDPFHFLCPQN